MSDNRVPPTRDGGAGPPGQSSFASGGGGGGSQLPSLASQFPSRNSMSIHSLLGGNSSSTPSGPSTGDARNQGQRVDQGPRLGRPPRFTDDYGARPPAGNPTIRSPANGSPPATFGDSHKPDYAAQQAFHLQQQPQHPDVIGPHASMPRLDGPVSPAADRRPPAPHTTAPPAPPSNPDGFGPPRDPFIPSAYNSAVHSMAGHHSHSTTSPQTRFGFEPYDRPRPRDSPAKESGKSRRKSSFDKRLHHFSPNTSIDATNRHASGGGQTASREQATAVRSFHRPQLAISSDKVFAEARLHPEAYLGRWTYDPTTRLPFRLRVNARFDVHLPIRYLDERHNHAIGRRKVWGTDIYTDDSDLAALVLHTHGGGMPSTGGDLRCSVRVLPRLFSYKGSTRNDLRSRGWSTPHDGLSLYLEHVDGTSWQEQVRGLGFAKRKLVESTGLKRTAVPDPFLRCDWRSKKYRRHQGEGSDLDVDDAQGEAAQVAQAGGAPSAKAVGAESPKPGDAAADTEDEGDDEHGDSAMEVVPDGDVTIEMDDQGTEAADDSYIDRSVEVESGVPAGVESKEGNLLESAPEQQTEGTNAQPVASEVLAENFVDQPAEVHQVDAAAVGLDTDLQSVRADESAAQTSGTAAEVQLAAAENEALGAKQGVASPKQDEKPGEESSLERDVQKDEASAVKPLSPSGPPEMTAESVAQLDREAAAALGPAAVDVTLESKPIDVKIEETAKAIEADTTAKPLESVSGDAQAVKAQEVEDTLSAEQATGSALIGTGSDPNIAERQEPDADAPPVAAEAQPKDSRSEVTVDKAT